MAPTTISAQSSNGSHQRQRRVSLASACSLPGGNSFNSMTTVAADQALAAYNAVARLTGRDFASEAEGI